LFAVCRLSELPGVVVLLCWQKLATANFSAKQCKPFALQCKLEKWFCTVISFDSSLFPKEISQKCKSQKYFPYYRNNCRYMPYIYIRHIFYYFIFFPPKSKIFCTFALCSENELNTKYLQCKSSANTVRNSANLFCTFALSTGYRKVKSRLPLDSLSRYSKFLWTA
jgi:hypothetical protein